MRVPEYPTVLCAGVEGARVGDEGADAKREKEGEDGSRDMGDERAREPPAENRGRIERRGEGRRIGLNSRNNIVDRRGKNRTGKKRDDDG